MLRYEVKIKISRTKTGQSLVYLKTITNTNIDYLSPILFTRIGNRFANKAAILLKIVERDTFTKNAGTMLSCHNCSQYRCFISESITNSSENIGNK